MPVGGTDAWLPPIPYDPDTSPWTHEGDSDNWNAGDDLVIPGGSYNTKTCKLIVKYYKNGASGTPPSDSVVTYSGEKKEVTLKRMVKGQSEEMSWTNHYFIGWSTTSNSTVPDTDPGDIIQWTWGANESGTKTVNLYAVWCENGRIIYKPGQYAKEASNPWHDKFQALPASGTITLRGAIFTRTGYDCVKWQTPQLVEVGAINSVQDVTTSPFFNSGGEVVLYPVWDPKKFNITFKSNTGDENQQDVVFQNVPYDSDVTLSTGLTFFKDNYHIFTWNENSDGTGATWFPGREYQYTVERNLTLYAQWAGNEHYVIYCETEEDARNLYSGFIVDCPGISLDENSNIISTSEDYPLSLDSGDILSLPVSNKYLDSDLISDYSVAVYGSPFYTDYRPKSHNREFGGWKTLDGTRLVKKDVWMDAYSVGSDATWTGQGDLVLYPIWNDGYPFGKIFFGRRESKDYGIIVNESPSYYWPERPYIHKNVRGKNGDVIQDSDYYKNVSKKYKITSYIKDDVQMAASKVSDFLHRYNGYPQYIRLEDSYEPDVYMLAIYEESNNLESIIGQAWKGTIEFNCKPQKYLLSGNKKIDIIKTGTLVNNPTNYPAFPIIQIWGVGTVNFYGRPTRVYTSGKITNIDQTESELKKVSLEIYGNYNRIDIDSETVDAVNANGDNMNAYISLDERILLYPGGNTITYSGNIERISIIPRWWRL